MEEFGVGIVGLVGDGGLQEPDKVLLASAEGLIVEDAVFDGDDYLEGAAAAEVGEDWTLAHFVFQSEEGFSRL